MTHNSAFYFLNSGMRFSDLRARALPSFKFLCQIPEAQSCSQREIIRLSLRDCLPSSPFFSPHSVSFALEPAECSPKLNEQRTKAASKETQRVRNSCFNEHKKLKTRAYNGLTRLHIHNATSSTGIHRPAYTRIQTHSLSTCKGSPKYSK